MWPNKADRTAQSSWYHTLGKSQLEVKLSVQHYQNSGPLQPKPSTIVCLAEKSRRGSTMSLWRSSPIYKKQEKHTETRNCSFAEPHCSISSAVFLSSDHISAAYLLFCFPSQFEYLGSSPTTCRQVKDSRISHLKIVEEAATGWKGWGYLWFC